MEQITLYDYDKSWQDAINEILNRIIVEEELPEQSLALIENYSKKKEKITSYTVSVKKPDYPKGINSNGIVKTPLLNIQRKSNQRDNIERLAFNLSDSLIDSLRQESFDVEIKTNKTNTQVLVNPESKDYTSFVSFVIKNAFASFIAESGHAFGCCSRFIECSDAKKCLHENKLYALGCAYSRNLRQGHFFYGKNRNV